MINFKLYFKRSLVHSHKHGCTPLHSNNWDNNNKCKYTRVCAQLRDAIKEQKNKTRIY